MEAPITGRANCAAWATRRDDRAPLREPYVKRSKTDAADAAGIPRGGRSAAHALRAGQELGRAGPGAGAQGELASGGAAHGAGERAAGAPDEFGIVAPVGPAGSARLIALLRWDEAPVPDLAVEALVDLCDMIAATSAKIPRSMRA